jgi:type I restriction enzyme S subunit
LTEGTKSGISTVYLSQLEGNWRVDAEYYQPHYLAAAEKLQNCGLVSDLIECALHPTEIRREYSEAGLQLLLAQNVRQNYLDFSTIVFMPEVMAGLLRKNRLRPGDVVMVRTGANFGDTAWYDGEPARLYASAHLILIRPKGIEGAYLSTYFNTKIGRQLIKRGMYGSSQPEIAPAYVETLPVPRGDTVEYEVVELVNQAREAQRESKRLYRQAEQLLLDELHFQKLDLADEVADEAPFSASLAVSRLDSEYFESKYLKLERGLDGYADKVELGTISTFSGGATPLGSDYIDKGIPFLRIQNVGENYLLLEDAVYVSPETHNGLLKRSKLRPGDVLITITGRIGTSTVVPDDLPTANINQHIVRVRLQNDLNPYYLSTYLNSPLGRLQALREAYGTTRDALPYYRLGTLQILLASDTVQQRVEETVRGAHSVRKLAQTLLEQAKHKVEAMIESELTCG